MSRTRVLNISDTVATLPLPYSGALPAGAGVIIADTVANVASNLGASVGFVFQLDTVAESNPANNASPPSAAITSDLLATGAVSDTTKIANGAVATADLAAGAVTEACIGALAVTNGKIGLLAVDSAQLAASAAIEAKIGTGAVTVDKIGAAAVTSIKQGIIGADGMGPELVIRVPFTAGTPGTADDVIIYDAAAPFAFRILDVQVLLVTTISASTAALRSAKAGAGSALSDSFDTHTAAGRLRDTGAVVTATPTVALSGTLVLRRSDRGIAGEVIIEVVKT
jgi:hypothetical protein